MALATAEDDMLEVQRGVSELVIGQLHCTSCRHPLGLVKSDGKRTYLSATSQYSVKIPVRKASIPCPDCDEVTEFNSRPMAAVRLGIGESE